MKEEKFIEEKAEFVAQMIEGWLRNLRDNLVNEDNYLLTSEVILLALEIIKQKYSCSIDISDEEIQKWLHGPKED